MYQADLDCGSYSKKSPLAVKGCGPDFSIIILQNYSENPQCIKIICFRELRNNQFVDNSNNNKRYEISSLDKMFLL